MRLIIVGSLKGQLITAAKIAVAMNARLSGQPNAVMTAGPSRAAKNAGTTAVIAVRAIMTGLLVWATMCRTLFCAALP